LTKDDKLELVSIERTLTVEKCLSGALLVNHKKNEKEVIKSIFLIVKRFNEIVNVGKKMNEDQMITLSSDLYERFSSESLEDIMLFFKMARSGEFGDFYRLDSIVILGWLPKYFDLKIQAREDAIQNERNVRDRQENESVKNHVPDEKAKEYLERLSRGIKVATVSRNVGVLRSDNPLFDYDTYLSTLPEVATKMTEERLKTMFDNTSKYSHPEVYNILSAEIEKRKKQPKKRKSNG